MGIQLCNNKFRIVKVEFEGSLFHCHLLHHVAHSFRSISVSESQCVQVTPIHVPSKFKAVALFLLKLTQFWFARSVPWDRTNKTVSRYYISESWRNKKVAIASTLWVVDNLTQLLLLLLLTSRNNCPHEQNQWLFILMIANYYKNIWNFQLAIFFEYYTFCWIVCMNIWIVY